MSTILLVGGGTAGHIMPHLALKPYLDKHYTKVYYVGSLTGMEKNIISAAGGFEYHAITTAKLNRSNMLKNVSLPYKFIKGTHEAKKLLKQLRPSIVFSKGGYVSLPVVVAAHSLGIPVVAHESDLSLGLANRLSKPFCGCICTTFEDTAKKIGKKGLYTGSAIKETPQKNTFLGQSNKPILLITGGSLGSKIINQNVGEIAKKLTETFYVIHQVGKNNINSSLKIDGYNQIEFADDMRSLISAAAVVVSRAGSNTIFELAYAKKPMLLIPLPKGASRGDQIDNAKYFSRRGYAKVLFQENLTSQALYDQIMSLYHERQQYIDALKRANLPNGTQKIVQVLLDYTPKYC
jgi:UDP-N-acetylglucosamine--N-acetylmuramyl-(pentapeptide) pyrophosphoryl-undecaprenol N-acetylglucosamine transferase